MICGGGLNFVEMKLNILVHKLVNSLVQLALPFLPWNLSALNTYSMTELHYTTLTVQR